MFLHALAPYLAQSQLEQADNLVDRRRDFYVIGPPLSLTNATHWFRVFARDGNPCISHAYVTCDSPRAPVAGIAVIGDANAARQWALNNWVEQLSLPPKTPASVEGYLLAPPDEHGQQTLQLAYVGLANVEWTVLGSDVEPLCELIDDNLVLAACWAPLVGEYSAVVRPALQLLHCSLCGGGLARLRCTGCGYQHVTTTAAGLLATEFSCCIPRRCAELMIAANYHRFKVDPSDARKREHAKWAATAVPLSPEDMVDQRPKRSIKL